MRLSQTQLRALQFLAIGPVPGYRLRGEGFSVNRTIVPLMRRGLVEHRPDEGVYAITQEGLNEISQGLNQ